MGGEVVSFSFVCSHLFLQDQDQVPDEDGRTVEGYSLRFRRLFGWGNLWRVPQKPIRACCGTAGLHGLDYGRFSCNPIQRVFWGPPPIASSPSLVVLMLMLDLPAFPSADYRICLLTCSAVV